MSEKEYSNNPEHSAMDVINRVLSDVGDIDRICIVCQDADGYQIHSYSNTRSTAEQFGMLSLARNLCCLEDREGY